jgi:hypothetical protein
VRRPSSPIVSRSSAMPGLQVCLKSRHLGSRRGTTSRETEQEEDQSEERADEREKGIHRVHVNLPPIRIGTVGAGYASYRQDRPGA